MLLLVQKLLRLYVSLLIPLVDIFLVKHKLPYFAINNIFFLFFTIVIIYSVSISSRYIEATIIML